MSLKVFVADVVMQDVDELDMEYRLIELENLVNTFKGVIILKVIQKKSRPDYQTYMGSGKLDEIMEEMQASGADVLIIGNIMKPHQIYNVNERLRKINAQCRDRVDLILKIFEKHANSIESKLQIELAAIRHMGPRIFGMGMELSRQGGSSGGAGSSAKGLGETNTERMKRHLKERERLIKERLKTYENVRKQHRDSRKQKGLNTVGIVGYTNAGKSSLLNSLTNKGVLAENKLFATLGTSVGKMFVQTSDFRGKEILLNDTIGFIQDLPPELIQAFKSTLEDSIESDILLHVVDANDPRIEEKINIVEEILSDIGANQKKLYVFNKIDLVDATRLEMLKSLYLYLNPIFISAHEKIGLDILKDRIIKELN